MAPAWWQRGLASALTCLTFIVVYSGCNYLASLRPFVGSCYFWWERYYPFIPLLIIPYWSIDGFFALAPLFISTRHRLRQHVLRILTAIFIAGFFFLTMPLTLAWPRPQVDGWLGPLFGSLNNFHNFFNCAPSLHIALRTLLWTIYVTPSRGAWRGFLALWFMLIGASTLLTWQHYIMDVITGQLLGLFCLHLFPSEPAPLAEVDRARGINASSRIARRYSMVTLALLGLTVAGWSASVLLLWPTISFFLMTVAYAGGGPGWLGKAHGTFPNGTYWLLAPYRWVAEQTFRYFSRKLPCTVEIAAGVYLSRRWSPAWKGPEPRSVLDLTAEYSEHEPWMGTHYLNIPVLDLTSPSSAQMRQAAQFIQTTAKPVLVHCSLGLGRSAAVGAAYLLLSGQVASPSQAMQRVRQLHPRAVLAPGVEEALQDLGFPPQ